MTHNFNLEFHLYKIFDRIYEGVFVHFEVQVDLDDILLNGFILDKNFSINKFYFNDEYESFLLQIRADKKKIIKDVEEYLTEEDLKEIFFDHLYDIQEDNEEVEKFITKYEKHVS